MLPHPENSTPLLASSLDFRLLSPASAPPAASFLLMLGVVRGCVRSKIQILTEFQFFYWHTEQFISITAITKDPTELGLYVSEF